MAALEPDDPPPGLSAFEVPDDARELDADRLAYYRELAARRRADRRATRRTVLPASWPRPGGGPGTSGSMVIGALCVLALLSGLLVTLSPRPATLPGPLPLASPATAVGDPGGLLPDATVRVGGQDRALRDARPVALVSLPDGGCDESCADALAALGVQAGQARVRVALVGPPDREAAMRAVAAETLTGAPVVTDTAGALDAAYDLTGTSAVLVHADGVVEGVYRDLGPATRLDGALATLAGPGATSTVGGATDSAGR